MKHIKWFAVVGAGLVVASLATANPVPAPGKAAASTERATMSGEIIDPQCYFTHDSRGPLHASCAAMCAKGGQGLAFLQDTTGTVYALIGKTHGASQNQGLLPYLGKGVQVKGVLYHKAGNSVLLIQSIATSPARTR